MEELQWQHESQTDRPTKLPDQPDYDFLPKQVTSIAEIQQGDLIRLYCGLFDSQHPYSIEDLCDNSPYGPPLKVTGFRKETLTEEAEEEIVYLEVEGTHNNLERSIPLQCFAVVEYPLEAGWDPICAIQTLQKG